MRASFAHPPLIRRRPPTDKTLNGSSTAFELATSQHWSRSALNQRQLCVQLALNHSYPKLRLQTLAALLRVAKSQHIYMHTNAPRGEIDFDLTISNTDNIIAKVADWRKQQQQDDRGGPVSSDSTS
jgi:hypothetical protein